MSYRFTLLSLSFCLLVGLALPACVEVLDEVGPVDASASELRHQGPATYRIRPDLRRCAWPFCGGHWVAQVNERTTQCPSGGRADWCYVLEVLGLPSDSSPMGEVLVQGDFETYEVEGFGEFADLRVREAWAAASEAQGGGTFFEVASTGIVCITSPCDTYEVSELGRGRNQMVNGVDLRASGATDEMVYEGYRAAERGGLRVAGVLSRERVNRRWSQSLTATQFYVPVVSNECLTADECTQSAYNRPVTGSDDCYCPICPEAMSAEEAAANQASWERYCSNVRLICPAIACFAPPGDVACVAGACTAGADTI